MKWEVRSRHFKGERSRPTPAVRSQAHNPLICIATPWGSAGHMQKILDLFESRFSQSGVDLDATAPTAKLTQLSATANSLRESVVAVNEAIYLQENPQQYQFGCELFAAALHDNECCWIQVGQPHIYLLRKRIGLIPLSSQLDLGCELNPERERLSAIPGQLLGVHPAFHFAVNSFRVYEGDRLLLLSSSFAPPANLELSPDEINIERLGLNLASQFKDQSFWLGILDICK